MDEVIFNISFLKSFILDIEMEKVLYEKMLKILLEEARDIRERYKGALAIEDFLKKVSRLKTKEEKEEAYKTFAEGQATEKYTYGDIFELLLEQSHGDKIAYAINYKKVNANYFYPHNNLSKITFLLCSIG